jgi:hypothetical protein
MAEIDLKTAKDYIYNIDFSQIISKMLTHGGWIQDDAVETCKQYRNFLYLNKKYADHILPPSLDIDHFWHEHILDTRKYTEDMDAIFGRYLHHYPYFGIDGKHTTDEATQCFQVTQDLYMKEFGERLRPTRSMFPKALYIVMCKLKYII